MTDTLFEFPCDVPLKIMGRPTADFRSLVLGIISRHAGEVDASKMPTAVMVPKLPPPAVNSTALVLAIAPPEAAPNVIASRA